MSRSFSAQISRYGVSETFICLMAGLRDTYGSEGKKFRREDVNKLAQYLVCRNYGKLCLELSYLMWAIVNSPTNKQSTSPLLEYFWLNEAITPQRFRHEFSLLLKEQNQHISLNKEGLLIVIESNEFTISPTRVGVLAVLMEFLTTLAPQQLASCEDALREQHDDKVIKTLSSELQKQIYNYLSEHLIPAQQQRRFRYVSQWLDEQQINQGIDVEQLLTDDAILAFWQFACFDDSSPGYKLYSSALSDFIDVNSALRQVGSALSMEHSISLGFDKESGEYSPESLEQIAFDQQGSFEDYSWLCSNPKFLTKSQWKFLQPLIDNRHIAEKITLSIMRLVIFGQRQAELVQAKRKSQSLLNERIDAPFNDDYASYKENLLNHRQVMKKVVLAVAHIFYVNRDSRFLGVAITCFSSAGRAQLKELMKAKVDDLDAGINKADDVLYRVSQELAIQFPEMKQLLSLAKKYFAANNKEGFQTIPEQEELDDYFIGFEALEACINDIDSFEEYFENKWSNNSQWQVNFASDASIFKSMFEKIYGDVYASST